VRLSAFFVVFVVALGPLAPRVTAQSAFPDAAPAEVGLDPAALARLGAKVQEFVDTQEIVGAELVVVAKHRTAYRATFGFEDLAKKTAMPPRGIFCVRSMTKPVCGTAIQMLVDREELALDDKIAQYFHSFDHGDAAQITVRHLLTHTGGLPLSQFLRRSLASAKDLPDIADVAGEFGPKTKPGELFNYSDDGADTLGALVEQLSGKTLDRFLAEELFEPLAMKDTIGVLKDGDPRLPRVHGAYIGGAKQWKRYWAPGQPPIFKFLLASQGLYASIDDYARFLALWMDGGAAGGKRLLTKEAVERALAPGPLMLGSPSGFRGWKLFYGQFWMVWVDPKRAPGKQVVAFGHNGSDGTFAYAVPELDLMVFYFTQSRQQQTGETFEKVLQEELLAPLATKKE
jgi:CubicO group peptidase (beta-lactamase class C family)